MRKPRENVIQYSRWRGRYSVFPKVILISTCSWVSRCLCRCLWSHIYSQDKSVKPGFELRAIDVAHLPEISPLQWFRVILIYIIAQFPSLAVPWAGVRQMACEPKISWEINMTHCLKSNSFKCIKFSLSWIWMPRKLMCVNVSTCTI